MQQTLQTKGGTRHFPMPTPPPPQALHRSAAAPTPTPPMARVGRLVKGSDEAKEQMRRVRMCQARRALSEEDVWDERRANVAFDGGA